MYRVVMASGTGSREVPAESLELARKEGRRARGSASAYSYRVLTGRQLVWAEDYIDGRWHPRDEAATGAQRKKLERRIMKDRGCIRVEVWIHPSDRALLAAFEKASQERAISELSRQEPE